ncbi:MAG: MBL fold metallo-hydrolase [Colwellia sp.]|nr:MBL fold metallo-hydrolase [Colwellia sp.]MCW8866486.1 MBL fold metallo-hydrolase [Colwellia sp.]MCW9080630.1 MBL fold metallo-hydrolase [Colwellia sp.]
MKKLHLLDGYIQTILLAEYPDKLLLLDGCSRADVSKIKHYINDTLGRPLTDLALVVVTHMHPDHAGAANKLRAISGCKIACANVTGQWYSGFDGKLMHITDLLLTRWVANKKQQKQRWLWYSSKLTPDFQLNDGDFLPGFNDWQALATQGHTDRDLSLHHLPSNKVYIADLIVTTRKGFIPPFPVFYPDRYRNSLMKIATLNADKIILAHGGEVEITMQQFEQVLAKAPTKPMTHWRSVKAKLKQVLSK